MAPIPQTMSGILIEEHGGIEVLKWKTDLPLPELKEGEVLVRNDFVGVNYIDTYFRSGLYPSPPPFITGKEASGTIIALHPSFCSSSPLFNGAKPKEGTPVAYLGDRAYAEYTAVPFANVFPIPAGLSPETACASMVQGLTALTFVREIVPVPGGEEGPWVLVHAAAGGTGGMLVQTLRAVVPNARVIGTAGGEAKCEVARGNGCQWVVDSSAGPEEVVKKVKEITGGKGVDVIFDGVGKATFEGDLEMAARRATLVVFGNASGPAGPVDLFKLSAKNLKLMRPMLFGYIATKEERDAYTKELFDLLLADKIKIKIHKVYPLKDVAQAHSDLEGRKTTGKLLLKI